MPPELEGLGDSKQITAKRREDLAPWIRRFAIFSCVIYISNRMIDKWGINPGTEFALLRALKRARRSGVEIKRLLMDGRFTFNSIRREGFEYETFKRGDSRIASIAAASILAKTGRDRRMEKFSCFFPAYEFESHKGYGTERHRGLIAEHGVSPLHRQSFDIIEQPMLDFGEP